MLSCKLFPFLLVFTVCIILLFLIINNNKLYEGYYIGTTNTPGLPDSIDESLNRCAKICKITAGCKGFQYDKPRQKCYISNDTIMTNIYPPFNLVCNKLNPSMSSSVRPPFDERRRNSVYVCRNSMYDQPRWYLHTRNNFVDIGQRRNLDDIFDIDNYSIYPFDYLIPQNSQFNDNFYVI